MPAGFESFNAFSRLRAAVPAACAGLLWGCLDNPSDGKVARAIRAEAYHPACVEAVRLLVLDEDAIDNGCAPNRFSARDVNDDIAAVGLRKVLPYFDASSGAEIALPSGEVGDEGWFALKGDRIAWRDAGPFQGDGLRNYLEAGPGLGSPNAKGNKESLLENVPELTPLRATGLAGLVGKSVCAVVLDGDAKVRYSPLSGNLQGANLGKVAFQVLSVAQASGNSNSMLPGVKVRILDAEAVCDDVLVPFLDAPALASNCEPRDLDPPACARKENLLVEPWDVLDPLKWEGDGEGMAEGGLFFAKAGSSSAIADWIHPCPLRLDSASAIRFSNRIQFQLSAENDFAESGALFFINAGDGSSYDDHVFVNVGYTTSPSKVFVELFGADGGEEFDQFMETDIPYGPSSIFNLDLWIGRDSYRVGVGGEVLDTVSLSSPISSLSLFEVGVQQNAGGLRGLLDQTSITALCENDGKYRPRGRGPREPRTRCQSRRNPTGISHARSDHGRCHHAKWKAEDERRRADRDRDREGGDSKRDRGPLAKSASGTPAVADPCGRNDLIRMARGKVGLLAHPPEGLLVLSRMKEVEGCVE